MVHRGTKLDRTIGDAASCGVLTEGNWLEDKERVAVSAAQNDLAIRTRGFWATKLAVWKDIGASLATVDCSVDEEPWLAAQAPGGLFFLSVTLVKEVLDNTYPDMQILTKKEPTLRPLSR